MNKKQAQNLSEDIRKQLDDRSFIDNVYLSIKGIGTKVFKECKCDQLEGWLFIWTKNDTFLMEEEDIGDFVLIDANLAPSLI